MAILTIKAKTNKSTTFVDSYKCFHTSLQNKINNKCKKHKKFKGVVNLKIQHSVSKSWYNFMAKYDVYE